MTVMLELWSTNRIRMLLPFALLGVFVGCATFPVNAMRHPGKMAVTQPNATEQEATVWFAYYEDQFDAFGAAVVAPVSMTEPQRVGFQRALSQFSDRAGRTYLMNSFIWAGILTVITLGIVRSQSPGYY